MFDKCKGKSIGWKSKWMNIVKLTWSSKEKTRGMIFLIVLLIFVKGLNYCVKNTMKLDYAQINIDGESVISSQPLGAFIDKDLTDVKKVICIGDFEIIFFTSSRGFQYGSNYSEVDGSLVQIFMTFKDAETNGQETFIFIYEDNSIKQVQLKIKNGILQKIE